MENAWNVRKEAIDPDIRRHLEALASLRSIMARDALKGGGAEVFQMFKKCGKGEQTFYFVVVSLYPTVNALDEPAVGYRKHINASVEGINMVISSDLSNAK